MLPILPALLLLLLSGSTKMDRAVAACLPGGLEALHRTCAAKPIGDAAKAERLWASLLALKVGPAEMGRALAALMAIDAATASPATPAAETAERVLQPPNAGKHPKRHDGWTRSCRTRDGPATR